MNCPAADAVHVWQVSFDETGADNDPSTAAWQLSVLSPEEKQRHDRFVFERHGANFGFVMRWCGTFCPAHGKPEIAAPAEWSVCVSIYPTPTGALWPPSYGIAR